MSQVYTFNTELLSANKFRPSMIASTYPLSGNGISITSLSSTGAGIVFNQLPTAKLTAITVDANINGNLFKIDTAYDGASMAVVDTGGTYTIFQFLSSDTIPNYAVGLSANYTAVSTPNKRRLWHLGYNA